MKVIGITGGVGAGKSEILSYIRKHYSCEIYLADEVANELKSPGTKCYEALLKVLGKECFRDDGQIDKAKMAEQIFRDPVLLQKVNDIIHPAVREYLTQKREQAARTAAVELFFVEAALLIEAGYRDFVDEMWYIYAREEVRKKRLRESRNYSDEKILNIMSQQLGEEAYRKGCDFVVDNSDALQDTYRQIRHKLEAFTWKQ